MVDRILGPANGTKRGNQKRQIRRERRIKVVIPPAGPTCSVRNADAYLIEDRILETAVLISNKGPLDLGDFSSGVPRITGRSDSAIG
jgi:hypothetical protein